MITGKAFLSLMKKRLINRIEPIIQNSIGSDLDGFYPLFADITDLVIKGISFQM